MENNEYKLTFGNRVIIYPGHNGYVMFNGTQPKSLTLYASEGGTLTANEITGLPGDTINLTTAYNTYWRFSGYELTGDGELVGDTYTFGTENATICACYKKNAFTATGEFEKGENINCYPPTVNNGNKTINVGEKYAIMNSYTGEIPNEWYENSSRWKITTDTSAYNIILNTKMTLGGQTEGGGGTFICSGWSFIGSNNLNLKVYTKQSKAYYDETISSTETGVYYGVNCDLYATVQAGWRNTATYFAEGTSGTWTATGYAP